MEVLAALFSGREVFCPFLETTSAMRERYWSMSFCWGSLPRSVRLNFCLMETDSDDWETESWNLKTCSLTACERYCVLLKERGVCVGKLTAFRLRVNSG